MRSKTLYRFRCGNNELFEISKDLFTEVWGEIIRRYGGMPVIFPYGAIGRLEVTNKAHMIRSNNDY